MSPRWSNSAEQDDREVMESESPDLREQNTSSTQSPIASESQVQQISNPKKPLLKSVNKITKNKKKNSGGCEEWMCTLCNHVFQGSYTRVWHHLLSMPGDGVKSCSYGLDKRMEMTKLHMVATGVSEANLDSDRPFKVPRLTPSSTEMQGSMNQSQINQLESAGGSTSERNKRSPSVAAEQICKIYNVVLGMRLMML